MVRETRLIVISPLSSITPDQITRAVHSLGLEVAVKETCYGALIEGEPETVREVLKKLKAMDPLGIYSKIRGFPMGDPVRCRSHHGSRPGFSQLEKEWQDLPLIQKGLESAMRGEGVQELEKKEPIPVRDLQRICEEVE
ncbi:MAG: hypothetical protein PWQ88_18 [Candidatus Methanomethylophilaceae archaeon]|nr:hypothetical protein [Candidatus Methanomethylophilaceae archaeon]MDI3541841.1 hypothetical protein [Candidatus Methanomethylophilaceae archaeon]HIJ00110.1 methanogenesis marker protein 6 [Candidatus Methanomethylophilaceae archaeon]